MQEWGECSKAAMICDKGIRSDSHTRLRALPTRFDASSSKVYILFVGREILLSYFRHVTGIAQQVISFNDQRTHKQVRDQRGVGMTIVPTEELSLCWWTTGLPRHTRGHIPSVKKTCKLVGAMLFREAVCGA